MAAACRVLGSQLMSALGRQRPPTSHSGRDVGLHHVLNRGAFLKRFWSNRAVASSTRPGEATAGISRAIQTSGGVFGALSPRGRRMEWGRHRAMVGLRVLRKGVLHPVPEQQLRILLTRVQSPYGHYNTQLSWSSFTRRELQHPGYPTRSSFTTEGE
ncbi:hypothetical protein Taro_038932 [Colocasia esculenta]|uniref:Uncharacterized protein n=1 Tax=Colocasia esculenta TaxID=4460 RepID=A0A843WU57_COLES|nr:hypothetical protein [Colocasia esculenta]